MRTKYQPTSSTRLTRCLTLTFLIGFTLDLVRDLCVPTIIPLFAVPDKKVLLRFDIFFSFICCSILSTERAATHPAKPTAPQIFTDGHKASHLVSYFNFKKWIDSVG